MWLTYERLPASKLTQSAPYRPKHLPMVAIRSTGLSCRFYSHLLNVLGRAQRVDQAVCMSRAFSINLAIQKQRLIPLSLRSDTSSDNAIPVLN